MKVFVSWSGERSKALASALGPWLRQTVQALDPWLSMQIDKGTRSGAQISGALEMRELGSSA